MAGCLHAQNLRLLLRMVLVGICGIQGSLLATVKNFKKNLNFRILSIAYPTRYPPVAKRAPWIREPALLDPAWRLPEANRVYKAYRVGFKARIEFVGVQGRAFIEHIRV